MVHQIASIVLEIKVGYLYSKPGRCGAVKCISFRKLERMINSKGTL
jgi:hypothetical protein